MSAVSAYDCVGMHATVKISMFKFGWLGFQNKNKKSYLSVTGRMQTKAESQ